MHPPWVLPPRQRAACTPIVLRQVKRATTMRRVGVGTALSRSCRLCFLVGSLVPLRSAPPDGSRKSPLSLGAESRA